MTAVIGVSHLLTIGRENHLSSSSRYLEEAGNRHMHDCPDGCQCTRNFCRFESASGRKNIIQVGVGGMQRLCRLIQSAFRRAILVKLPEAILR